MISTSADKQSLHLPRRHTVFQLFGKLIGISGSVEGFDEHERGCLMLAVIVTRGGMVRDDDVGTKFANLQNHATRSFFVSPKPEGFITRLRKSKIFQTEKVWL